MADREQATERGCRAGRATMTRVREEPWDCQKCGALVCPHDICAYTHVCGEPCASASKPYCAQATDARAANDREWAEGVRQEKRDAGREQAGEMERRVIEGHATGTRPIAVYDDTGIRFVHQANPPGTAYACTEIHLPSEAAALALMAKLRDWLAVNGGRE